MSEEGVASAEGGSEEAAAAPSRPDAVPEKFWDPVNNQVNVNDLASAYTTLEQSYTKKTEDIRADVEKGMFANRPDSPASYEAVIPKIEGLPEGWEVNVDTDSEIFQYWRDVSHKAGFSQEQFNEGVQKFLEFQMGGLPSLDDEISALGERGQERYERARDWLRGALSEDEMRDMSAFTNTAKGVAIVEKMMEKSGVPFQQNSYVPSRDAADDPKNSEAYDAKTRSLMATDEYLGGDPGMLQVVRDRWKRAYPD